jgi:hypothetical protein
MPSQRPIVYLAGAALASAVVILACGQGHHDRCQLDADCEEGLFCDGNFCLKPGEVPMTPPTTGRDAGAAGSELPPDAATGPDRACEVKPATTATDPGLLSPPIYGHIYVRGLTDKAGAGANLLVQLGIGPHGSNPNPSASDGGAGDWTWVTASFNRDESAAGMERQDDVYAASVTSPGAAPSRTPTASRPAPPRPSCTATPRATARSRPPTSASSTSVVLAGWAAQVRVVQVQAVQVQVAPEPAGRAPAGRAPAGWAARAGWAVRAAPAASRAERDQKRGPVLESLDSGTGP